ncbi:MAG: hypothetical protein WCG78_04635, partial [Candidatus Omnitrophota bacterium]
MKTVSLAVVVAFMWNQVVFAQDGVSALLAQKESGKIAQKGLETVEIPYDIGAAQKLHKDTGNETVIHIQDAHDSFDAQGSIVKILENLASNYDLRFVAQEGSAGYVDTSFLKTFPIDDVKKRTAEHFMGEGLMSAAEFFTICSKDDIALYGIEDEGLYGKDLASFKYIIETGAKLAESITALQASLDTLKPLIYTRETIALTQSMQQYRQGKIGFGKHWELLMKLAGSSGAAPAEYQNINILLGALDLESRIDFGKAESEREEAVKGLCDKLDKPGLEKFVMKALAFKSGKLSKGEFHAYLRDTAARLKVNLAPYRELSNYIKYIASYETIDIGDLFKEIGSAENAVKGKLFIRQDQKDLNRYLRYTELLKGLFEASLSADDYQELVSLGTSTGPRDLIAFIRENGTKYQLTPKGEPLIDAIIESIPRACEFYELAEKRNAVILDNTIRRMRENNQTVAALVTGGFHTKGLTNLLKERKLSYLVILPRVADIKKKRPYITVITNKQGPYQTMLADGKYLAVYSFFPGGAVFNKENVLIFLNQQARFALSEEARRLSEEGKSADEINKECRRVSAEWVARLEAQQKSLIGSGQIASRAISIDEMRQAVSYQVDEVRDDHVVVLTRGDGYKYLLTANSHIADVLPVTAREAQKKAEEAQALAARAAQLADEASKTSERVLLSLEKATGLETQQFTQRLTSETFADRIIETSVIDGKFDQELFEAVFAARLKAINFDAVRTIADIDTQVNAVKESIRGRIELALAREAKVLASAATVVADTAVAVSPETAAKLAAATTVVTVGIAEHPATPPAPDQAPVTPVDHPPAPITAAARPLVPAAALELPQLAWDPQSSVARAVYTAANPARRAERSVRQQKKD